MSKYDNKIFCPKLTMEPLLDGGSSEGIAHILCSKLFMCLK